MFPHKLQNPINLIYLDGNAPLVPIKQVLYKRTKGITGNYHLKGFNIVPASTKSWSGGISTGSDPLSNITRISSSGATSPTLGALGGPVEHFYKYDQYNRLIIAEGNYTGPDDEVPDMLKQAYSLEMEYDLSHNILQKNQVHQFGSVSSINEQLPADARHAVATSYKLDYSGYGSGTFAHRQPHAPRKITEYPQEDYSGNLDVTDQLKNFTQTY